MSKRHSQAGTPPPAEKPVAAHEQKQTPAQVRRKKDPETIAQELATANGLPLVKWSIMENDILKVQLKRDDPRQGDLFLYEPMTSPE